MVRIMIAIIPQYGNESFSNGFFNIVFKFIIMQKRIIILKAMENMAKEIIKNKN